MLLVINERLSIPKSEFELTFTRSSGPGGQNVNKVNSKAMLRWQPSRNQSLPPAVIERFLARYRSRLTLAGELILTSQRFRDQARNIDDCLEKLKGLIEEVAEPPKARKATKVSRAAKRRRLDDKRRQSAKKQNRSGRVGED